jgi:hypothetical protein
MLEHLHPLVAQPTLIHHLPLLGDLIRAQWQFVLQDWKWCV